MASFTAISRRGLPSVRPPDRLGRKKSIEPTKDGPLHSNGKQLLELDTPKRSAKSSKHPPANGRSEMAPPDSPRSSKHPAPNGRSEVTPADWRKLLQALEAAGRGDFTMRIPENGHHGPMSALATAFNRVASMNEALVSEIVRVGRIVGREGRMTERASLDHADGGWSRILEAINS